MIKLKSDDVRVWFMAMLVLILKMMMNRVFIVPQKITVQKFQIIMAVRLYIRLMEH